MRVSRCSHLFGGSPFGILLVLPASALLGVFVLWPALQALVVSCTSWAGFTPHPQWVGLDNYLGLWQDARFWASLKNTLYFALVGGALHFSFAFLFTATLTHPFSHGRKLFQTMIVFPTFIAVSGVAILWALLYEPQFGLFNHLLKAGSIPPVVWLDPRWALNAVIVCSLWAGVGTHLLILLAGVRRIPRSVLDAARLDGASERTVFLRMVTPMLRRTTHAALALWIIGSVQLFGLMQTFAGPEIPFHLETLSTYQFAIAFNSRDNIYLMGQGTAVAVVQAALILLALLVLGRVLRRGALEY